MANHLLTGVYLDSRAIVLCGGGVEEMSPSPKRIPALTVLTRGLVRPIGAVTDKPRHGMADSDSLGSCCIRTSFGTGDVFRAAPTARYFVSGRTEETNTVARTKRGAPPAGILSL